MTDEEEMRRHLELTRISTLAAAAEARSRQALSVATDTRRQAWMKSDHDEYEAELCESRMRRERWTRRLILLTTVVVAFAVTGAVISFLLADRARLMTQVQLNEYRQNALTACQARNAALTQQVITYDELRRIESSEINVQTPEFVAEKQRAYDRAVASLPNLVDCAVWEIPKS